MKNYYKSPLLIPISVGSMKLKNRLVTLPMGMMLADEHGAITGGRNNRTISYYEEKAKGVLLSLLPRVTSLVRTLWSRKKG